MDSRINSPPRLPVIDLSLFELGDPWRSQVAAEIDAASSEFGCFIVVGHGIDVGVVEPLMAAGRRFFATEEAVKRREQVESHARARHDDYSPVEELAARSADLRNLSFEAQLALGNDHVRSATSVARLSFLPDVPGMREPVLDYMRSLSGLSHKLMALLARGLRLADSYFVDRYTGSPATSFRIRHYPQVANERAAANPAVGAGEPGFLTLLKQDVGGGLELNYRQRWVALPSVPNSFICNLGQALARLTNGRYVSSAHRMRNSTRTHRLSMAFCFEPSVTAALEPIAGVGPSVARAGAADEGANASAAHRQIA
jgi:isopenicillin N synthase-like dioxygenase